MSVSVCVKEREDVRCVGGGSSKVNLPHAIDFRAKCGIDNWQPPPLPKLWGGATPDPVGVPEGTRKVDVRLPGKGDSNSHGARPVHLSITMIKWIRTSRLSIKNSLCRTQHFALKVVCGPHCAPRV